MSETVTPKAEELLTTEPLVAHLATSTNDRPHVAPLWYRYEDGRIVVMTTGQKLSNLKENSRVALSIQKDYGGHPEWMVTIKGTATVIENAKTNREQNRKLNRKYDVEDDAWEDENTLVRIDIGVVSYKVF